MRHLVKSIKSNKRLRKLSADVAVALLFILIALWLTRPWISRPLAQGIGTYDQAHQLVATDVMMSMTFAGWLKFAVTQLHQSPFAYTTYLMYPIGATHGRSFDGLFLALITAALSCAVPLMTAQSIGELLGVFLCGYLFYRFACRRWGRGWLPLGLGLSSLCMPFLYQRLCSHPNLVYIWTIPLAIHLFHNFQAKPTWKRTVAWSLSFPLLAMSSWYILIMGLVSQGVALLIFGLQYLWRRQWPRLARLGAGWALGLTLCILVGWPMFRSAGTRVQYDSAMLATYSAPAVQFLMPFPNSFFGQQAWAQSLQKMIGSDWEGLAGGPILSLILLALYAGWRKPQGPRMVIILTALAAFVISLGPYLHVFQAQPPVTGIKMPTYYLGRLSKSFNFFRVPGRMHPLVNFMALLATGYLFNALRLRLARQPKLGRPLWPALVGGMVALNVLWSIHPNLSYVAFPEPRVPAFYTDLGKTPGRGAVLDLPISYYWFPHYNYYQLWHKRPNVSSVLFHDAPGTDAILFTYGKPEFNFFLDGSRDASRESEIPVVTGDGFMQKMSQYGIEYVIVHPKLLKFIIDLGIADAQTAGYYETVEKTWAGHLIDQDDEIRVYRTQPPATHP